MRSVSRLSPLFTFALSACLLSPAVAAGTEPPQHGPDFHPATSKDEKRIARWSSWRFGALIHFNMQQFGNTEFSQIKDPKVFNPTRLDMGGLVEACQSAGMKYGILTARHTSEFCLWSSKVNPCNAMASPVKTDVLGAFFAESRRRGFQPGIYYCMWGGKGWNTNPGAKKQILAELDELATGYGPVAAWWLDMLCWAPADLSAQEIYNFIRQRQPDSIIHFNQHIGDGQKIAYFPTDVLNGEVHLPSQAGHDPWREVGGRRYYLPFQTELCSQYGPQSLKNGIFKNETWFTYGAAPGREPSKPYDPKEIAKLVKQAWARGASNVLLSLAPDHTGKMRPGDVKQLKELGELLKSPEDGR